MPSNDMAESGGLRPQDFDSIRDAVMETPRGRWFLSEFANRLRSAETGNLLDSMRRIETAVAANHDALMSRLAQAIANPSAPAASAPQPELAPKHMKFFKQDEEIFEPALQAKLAAVPDTPKPEPRPEAPKGARVIIKRSAETQLSIEAIASAAAAPESSAAPVEQPPALEAAPSAPAPSAESVVTPPVEAQPKRRITIIRHKPGEDIDVPLENEIAKAS